ncbi:MAG: hypothetical protein M1828_000558 [Chrysothrix sp. TS-e1954]|nr:MAG: hypothetical protein M1828_000558 [Chrysothrix sp. TS-e1954]
MGVTSPKPSRPHPGASPKTQQRESFSWRDGRRGASTTSAISYPTYYGGGGGGGGLGMSGRGGGYAYYPECSDLFDPGYGYQGGYASYGGGRRGYGNGCLTGGYGAGGGGGSMMSRYGDGYDEEYLTDYDDGGYSYGGSGYGGAGYYGGYGGGYEGGYDSSYSLDPYQNWDSGGRVY